MNVSSDARWQAVPLCVVLLESLLLPVCWNRKIFCSRGNDENGILLRSLAALGLLRSHVYLHTSLPARRETRSRAHTPN